MLTGYNRSVMLKEPSGKEKYLKMFFRCLPFSIHCSNKSKLMGDILELMEFFPS